MEYPKDIFLSPRKAIQRFSQILQRCHPESVRSGNNYRQEKEALIAATALIGYEVRNNEKYWLQNAEYITEYITKDFDIKVVGRIDNDLNTFEAKAMWQITEFESHAEDFIDVIRNKQKRGYKPGDLDLLINVREKEGWTFAPEDLAKEVRNSAPTYRSIKAVLNSAQDFRMFNVIELFPELKLFEFDIEKALNDASPPDYLRQQRRCAKVSSIEDGFEIPLPTCPLCDATESASPTVGELLRSTSFKFELDNDTPADC